jgi:NAD(P)-dependent dehydrogenase (short-subunit alcohol dehydrogenase family)
LKGETYKMSKRFKEKVALITGSAKGLGKAIAGMLAEEGASISIADISENIKKTAQEFKAQGFNVICQVIDVSKPQEIKKMVDVTCSEFGKIDCLINNAALPYQGPLMDIKWEDWDPIINVNLKGAFFVLQNTARKMIEKGNGGSIVNISSLAGSGGRPLYIPYAASKAAVMNMTQSAAKALAGYNIRVNSISPGNMYTEMFVECAEEVAKENNSDLEKTLDIWKKRIPLNRFGQPSEIAKAVLFLCSDDSSYITGQIYNVCGGLSIP